MRSSVNFVPTACNNGSMRTLLWHVLITLTILELIMIDECMADLETMAYKMLKKAWKKKYKKKFKKILAIPLPIIIKKIEEKKEEKKEYGGGHGGYQ